ncbi:MAG TPA: heavy metal-binding domain-containing protein [Vicinamibacterales bacterium]|nr:heavy metal-binding domain-containing protein [Vicinamibacterales bacterium]
MRDLRIYLLLWLAVGGFVQSPGPPAGPRALRFHHIHYRVGDPSAAMNAVAPKLEGVRVVVPGLGVGVRAGAEYLLFDRLDDSAPPDLSQMTVPDAYASAVAWLAARGLTVTPGDLNRLRVSRALPAVPYHHIAFVANDLSAVGQTLVAAGAAALRSSEDAMLFDAGSVLVEIVRDADRAETYWCPMHPDVRSADEGKCPVCGMTLVAIPPPKIGEYNLDVTQVRDTRGPGLTGLRLTVREPETNAAVTTFATVHEKRLHLFVVSRDLEYFAHVHPELAGSGTFVVHHPLPPGEYMLIADFLPQTGTSQMVQKAVIVNGAPAVHAPQRVESDLLIRLETQDLRAGRHAVLTFTLTDPKTGAPVTDLQPYLGAPAHMLIVRRDLADAIHGHPEEASTGGPTISFHPLMPAAGDYRLWIQVQRAGQVITKVFDVTVKP